MTSASEQIFAFSRFHSMDSLPVPKLYYSNNFHSLMLSKMDEILFDGITPQPFLLILKSQLRGGSGSFGIE